MFPYLIQAHVSWITLRRVLRLGSRVDNGIFVVAGTAAKNDSGARLFVSFTIVRFSVFLSGFCHAEFSSRVPVAGSALEYGVSASTVAIGWSGYLKSWMKDNLRHLVFGTTNKSDSDNAIISISFAAPVYRIKASANFTLVITVWNLCLILLFIIVDHT